MPNSLMEAMALGIPCISTDCPCGGPRFLIKDGYNGYLVPTNDTYSLYKTMTAMVFHMMYGTSRLGTLDLSFRGNCFISNFR